MDREVSKALQVTRGRETGARNGNRKRNTHTHAEEGRHRDRERGVGRDRQREKTQKEIESLRQRWGESEEERHTRR